MESSDTEQTGRPGVISTRDCLVIALALQVAVLAGLFTHEISGSVPVTVLAAGHAFLSLFRFLDRLLVQD